MKTLLKAAFIVFLVASFSACQAKKGCKSNGKNVGAEKLASGDPKATKEAKRAGKFKHNKIPY